MSSSDNIIKKILKDIRVELADEFDQNFARQGFFSEAWARHRTPMRQGSHILVKTGNLRRSIRSNVEDRAITFSSDLIYAGIHNEGGKIRVTARMKRYFWARYYETTGGFKRRKNGSLSKSKKQVALSTEAEFWKHMALMKVGSEITIPRRRFLGTSPELEKNVTDIIQKNLEEYFNTQVDNIRMKYE
jgi:phage gpG-like protein